MALGDEYFQDIDEPAESVQPSATPSPSVENPQPQSGDEFFQDIDQTKPQEVNAIQGSMFSGMRKDPDQHAKVINLSDKTGFATAITERNYEKIDGKWQRRNRDYNEIVSKSPGLGRFLEDKDNAAVVHDDLENASHIDHAASAALPLKGATKDFFDIITRNPIEQLFKKPESYEKTPEFRLASSVFDNTPYFRAVLSGFSNKVQAYTGYAVMNRRIDPYLASAIIARQAKANETLEELRPDYSKRFNEISEVEGRDVNRTMRATAKAFKDMTWKDAYSYEVYKAYKEKNDLMVHEVLDYVKKVAHEPIGILYGILENAPSALETIIAGASGAKYLGLFGFSAGTFFGEYPIEGGSTFIDALSKENVDLKDQDAVSKFLTNDRWVAEHAQDAKFKALGTAGTDALMIPLSGAIGAKLAGKGLLSKATAAIADLGVETGGEISSEAIGQYIKEGGDVSKIDFGEALKGGILSAGQSAGQAAIGRSLQTAKAIGSEDVQGKQSMQEAFSDALKPMFHTYGEKTEGQSIRAEYSKNPTEASREIAEDTDKALSALSTAKNLEALGTLVNESKLTKRELPQKVKELINQATDNNPDASVLFQPGDWDSYWLEQGESPAAMAEKISGNSEMYLNAKESGTALRFSLSNYVSQTVQTKHYNNLLPVLITSEDGMRSQDAVKFMQSLPATFDEVAGEDQVLVEPNIEEQVAAYRATKEQELITLGKYTPEQISANLDVITGPYKQILTRLQGSPVLQKMAAHRLDTLKVTDRITIDQGTLEQPAYYGFGDLLLQPQRGSPPPRGAFSPSQNLVAVLKNGDVSTFVHEMWHSYWDLLQTIATSEGAPQDFVADWQTMRDYLGKKEGEALTKDDLEKLADLGVTYLQSGQAPSESLKPAFDNFKNWLIEIWKYVSTGVPYINDDIRDVMDRLIASKEEISAAIAARDMQASLPTSDTLGMTGQAAVDYEKSRKAFIDGSESNLNKHLLSSLREDRKKFLAQERERIKARVTYDIDNSAPYKAGALLKSGTLPNGDPLPAGVEAIKLDKKSISDLKGKDFIKQMNKNMMAEDGLHVEIAAGALGFSSATEMLDAMANLPSRSEAIKSATDIAMLKEHGDPLLDSDLPDQVIAALHNEHRADLLGRQLKQITDANADPALKKVAAERLPYKEWAKQEAARRIARSNLREIRPRSFLLAEKKHAVEAERARLKGDYVAQFISKKNELLAHELFREAMAAREAINNYKSDTPAKFFKQDSTLSKTHDIDYINAGRTVLQEAGLGRSAETDFDYLKSLQSYDLMQDVYESIAGLIKTVPKFKGDLNSGTYDDFLALKEATDAMWELSLRSKQFDIEGVKVSRDDLIQNELKPIFDERITNKETPGAKKDLTKGQIIAKDITGVKAALRIVESWVDAMDKGNIKGMLRKVFITPLFEGTAAYRERKQIEITKLISHLETVKESFKGVKIYSPELDYTFKDHSTLLHAVLHAGNDSNLQKLLRGRGWGEFDINGVLDRSRWDKFIARAFREGILTKTHMDFAQAVWNLNESLKPDLQRAHKEMYGYYFNEVTANTFRTPFGDYRGGYIPAKVDPELNTDSKARQDKETIEGNNTFAFPTAGRGATKTRIEAYAAPLKLDLRLLPAHIDWALKFIHIEPKIKDLARVVNDKNFRKYIGAMDSEIVSDMLVPWLQRTALQKVTMPSGTGRFNRFLDKYLGYLRSNTGFNIMVGSVSNAAQQFTGLATAHLKVKHRFLRGAFIDILTSPRKTSNIISEKSIFMRNEMTSQAYEMNQTIDEILFDPGIVGDYNKFMNPHGYFLQKSAQGIVNNIIWIGSYNESLASGLSETEAIRKADSSVRLTQGSFAPESVSRFQVGSPGWRMMAMFTGYFNMQANLIGSEISNVANTVGLKKGAGRLFYIYMMGFMLPAVISDLISKTISGRLDEDDDDQYLDDVLDSFIWGQFRTATAMVPFVGQAVNYTVNKVRGKYFNEHISISPVFTQLESAGRSVVSVPQAVFGKGDDRKAVKDGLTLLGLLGFKGAGAAARPLGYAAGVNEGKIRPKGPVDFTRGMISGSPASGTVKKGR